MITKTVVLVWDEDNTCWRDQQTGILVTGHAAPHPGTEFVEAGRGTFTSRSDEPLIPRHVDVTRDNVQSEGWHHPFDKSYAVTYEQVQKMIDDAFTQRVIPQAPPYMMDDEWIVNYKWLRREGDYRQSRIDDLQRQVEQLKARRWWKRW